MKEKKLSKQLFYFYDVLFDMKMTTCDAFFAKKNNKMAHLIPQDTNITSYLFCFLFFFPWLAVLCTFSLEIRFYRVHI